MAKPDMRRKRPLRVTIIGTLSILEGLIFLFPALGKYGLGKAIILSGLTFQSGPFLFTALAVAIANLIVGIGCLYGWRPVWFYLIIISTINFVIALFVILNVDQSNLRDVIIGWVWLVIAAYSLLVTISNKSRTWFRV